MSIFTKISDIRKNTTTYKAGLLQTKAYRTLKNKTTLTLKPYKISAVDWACLGVLFDAQIPLRASEVAKQMDVELPFITEISKQLSKDKIIEFKKDPKDSRIKLISLTEKGRSLVPEVEKVMRAESKKWFVGASIRDLVGYLRVLNKIVEN